MRSAKRTILDVIGQPLDFQLRTEAWNAYACADPEETMALLERFYEKTERRPPGEHETELQASLGPRSVTMRRRRTVLATSRLTFGGAAPERPRPSPEPSRSPGLAMRQRCRRRFPAPWVSGWVRGSSA